MREFKLFDVHADLLSYRLRIRAAGVRKQQLKLVAAESRNHVGRAQHMPQQAGDLRQALIADFMSAGVVELLEMIQVEERQRQLLLGALPAPHSLLDFLLKMAMREQSRQRIGDRRLIEYRVLERRGSLQPQHLQKFLIFLRELLKRFARVDVQRAENSAAGGEWHAQDDARFRAVAIRLAASDFVREDRSPGFDDLLRDSAAVLQKRRAVLAQFRPDRAVLQSGTLEQKPNGAFELQHLDSFARHAAEQLIDIPRQTPGT